MLPKPQCAFTIPSLHDGLRLEGRLYFPRETVSHATALIRGFAIIAHPYAPLGGSWDDPIVQTIGALLIQQGFVVSTFNFRGANGSHRSTSWTGKAELADYVSFSLLLLCLINAPEVAEYASSIEQSDANPLLILGGYSYGSLIASHLPALDTIRKLVETARHGSSIREIQSRALEVSKTLLGYLESQLHQGHVNAHDSENADFPAYRRGLAMGGSESGSNGRRISRESLRNSAEKLKHKLISRGSSHRGLEADSTSISPGINILPTIAYLLVSPLLPPISGITTLFSRLEFDAGSDTSQEESANETLDYKQSLTRNHTIAIYGNRDGFTSARKLHRWTRELESMPGSRFISKEIVSVGHFWTEDGAKSELCNAVRRWLDTLVGRQST